MVEVVEAIIMIPVEPLEDLVVELEEEVRQPYIMDIIHLLLVQFLVQFLYHLHIQ